ncbi:hypothetical protein LTS18_010296 [Coniosporium uncinatum]|uniref:Uncharacterized protein n=1 Tax=Coniosporium uncinatum TaxID=93489 RepID=A0ACC3D9V8_9PEZI|nr:hypothetical protein LTS18_010296 [Coniosporium uncinatum]
MDPSLRRPRRHRASSSSSSSSSSSASSSTTTTTTTATATATPVSPRTTFGFGAAVHRSDTFTPTAPSSEEPFQRLSPAGADNNNNNNNNIPRPSLRYPGSCTSRRDRTGRQSSETRRRKASSSRENGVEAAAVAAAVTTTPPEQERRKIAPRVRKLLRTLRLSRVHATTRAHASGEQWRSKRMGSGERSGDGDGTVSVTASRCRAAQEEEEEKEKAEGEAEDPTTPEDHVCNADGGECRVWHGAYDRSRAVARETSPSTALRGGDVGPSSGLDDAATASPEEEPTARKDIEASSSSSWSSRLARFRWRHTGADTASEDAPTVRRGGRRISAPTLTATTETQRTASVSVPHHEEMRGSTSTWPPHSRPKKRRVKPVRTSHISTEKTVEKPTTAAEQVINTGPVPSLLGDDVQMPESRSPSQSRPSSEAREPHPGEQVLDFEALAMYDDEELSVSVKRSARSPEGFSAWHPLSEPVSGISARERTEKATSGPKNAVGSYGQSSTLSPAVLLKPQADELNFSVDVDVTSLASKSPLATVASWTTPSATTPPADGPPTLSSPAEHVVAKARGASPGTNTNARIGILPSPPPSPTLEASLCRLRDLDPAHECGPLDLALQRAYMASRRGAAEEARALSYTLPMPDSVVVFEPTLLLTPEPGSTYGRVNDTDVQRQQQQPSTRRRSGVLRLANSVPNLNNSSLGSVANKAPRLPPMRSIPSLRLSTIVEPKGPKLSRARTRSGCTPSGRCDKGDCGACTDGLGWPFGVRGQGQGMKRSRRRGLGSVSAQKGINPPSESEGEGGEDTSNEVVISVRKNEKMFRPLTVEANEPHAHTAALSATDQSAEQTTREPRSKPDLRTRLSLYFADKASRTSLSVRTAPSRTRYHERGESQCSFPSLQSASERPSSVADSESSGSDWSMKCIGVHTQSSRSGTPSLRQRSGRGLDIAETSTPPSFAGRSSAHTMRSSSVRYSSDSARSKPSFFSSPRSPFFRLLASSQSSVPEEGEDEVGHGRPMSISAPYGTGAVSPWFEGVQGRPNRYLNPRRRLLENGRSKHWTA